MVAVVLVGALLVGFLPVAAGASGEVTVPSVVGVRLDKAIKALGRAGLSDSHHDDVKDRSRRVKSSWRVINQDPPPGSTVAAGTEVRLGARHKDDLTWPGQPPVAVPNVVGLRLDKARKALRKGHLRARSFDAVRVGNPRKQKNDKNWTVVAQEPAGEATVPGGSELRVGVRHKKDRAERPPPPAATVPTTAAVPPAAGPAGDVVTVSRVVDGDTIEVAGRTRVRFIGVDTPEVSGGAECFGREASAHTARLLPVGTEVRLVYDLERTDRYGRTLAYLYRVSDGLFVNLALARDGFAQQLTVPPNVAHAEEIRQAVAEARTATRALWSACPAPAPPAPSPAEATARTVPTRPPPTMAAPAPSGGCHASYRGACVPIAEDVDCAGGKGNGPAYVSATDIQVVGPDVYGLDGNGDGVGCESRP